MLLESAGEDYVGQTANRTRTKLSMRLHLPHATLCAGLVACATPYQQRGARGGYTDHNVADGVYYVAFEGNGYTSPAAVASMWHRRARELCAGDYDVVDRDPNSDVQLVSLNGQPTTVTRHRVEGHVRCVSMPSVSVPAKATKSQEYGDHDQPGQSTPSVIEWHCFEYPAVDGRTLSMCGTSRAICVNSRMVASRDLQSKGENTPPSDCVPRAEAFCSVGCDPETGFCNRDCFESQGDCQFSRAAFPELYQGIENVASDGCFKTDPRSPPPGEGWGWWCSIPDVNNLDAPSMCERTRATCEYFVRNGLAAGDCRHVPSLACYASVLRVREFLSYSCFQTFSKCEANRKMYASRPDYVEVGRCETLY